MQKALLAALLNLGELRKIELAGNNAGRLALFEELKTMRSAPCGISSAK
jgi:L-rhamnose isomerase